jgi:hypothetical protein
MNTASEVSTLIPSLSTEASELISCYYVNRTHKLQIIRIKHIPNQYFERVVFPGQWLIFESLPEAFLEVHTHEYSSAVLADRILCRHLAVTER